MDKETPAVKTLLGVMGVLSILSGLASAILGLAAWGIAHQHTGTEGLAVIFVVAIQWVVALIGGYILGGTAAQRGRKAGLYLNAGSVVITAIALMYHYHFGR
jgi:hypothetical protein